jgi:predicted CXXCH cytochrome family protein
MKQPDRLSSAGLPSFLVMCLALIGALSTAAAAANYEDRPAASGGAAHESISCTRCHATRTASFSESPAMVCTSCHADGSTGGDRVLQAFHTPGRSCADCHSFHDPMVVRAKDVRFHVARREECAACHVPGKDLSRISEGHRAAAAYYHSDHEDSDAETPSEVCLDCHSRTGGGRSTSLQVSLVTTPPQFHEEATHPFGIEVPLGSNGGLIAMRDPLDPRIRLIDGKIECLTCHDLTETAKDALVRFDSKYDLCLGCHQMNNRRESAASFAQQPIDPQPSLPYVRTELTR